MASGTNSGTFRISGAPVESSAIAPEGKGPDLGELPSHYGEPLLLVIPRNPQTLFICWSVDWAAVFRSDLPADRQAHVMLTTHSTERTIAVEPMNGHCSVAELEPGESYAVDLGYYAPANRWRLVASAKVTMPWQARDAETLDVATIPFHLSFQRLMELFGGHISLAQSLAAFGERMAKDSIHSGKDEALLRELDLSPDDLKFAEAIRSALEKTKTRPRVTNYFYGSSFGGS